MNLSLCPVGAGRGRSGQLAGGVQDMLHMHWRMGMGVVMGYVGSARVCV